MKKLNQFSVVVILFTLFSFLSVNAKSYLVKTSAYYDVPNSLWQKNKWLLIKDNKILEILDKKPENNKLTILDLSDYFLLPSFFDCHTHLFIAQNKSDKDFEKALIREGRLAKKNRYKRAKLFAKEYATEGFSYLCDLGNSNDSWDLELAREIEKDAAYPMIFGSGKPIATQKAQYYKDTKESVVKREYYIWPLDEQNQKSFLVLNKKIIKVYADNSPGEGEFSEKNWQEFIRFINANNFFQRISIHYTSEIKMNLESLKNNLVFEHGNSLLANSLNSKKNWYVTPTVLTKEQLIKFDYYHPSFYRLSVENLKKYYTNNWNLIFGPDFYFFEDGLNRAKESKKTIQVWLEAGIPFNEIIKALTINPARSLEFQNAGEIKKNGIFNVVGFLKNPEEMTNLLTMTPNLVINKGVVLKQ